MTNGTNGSHTVEQLIRRHTPCGLATRVQWDDENDDAFRDRCREYAEALALRIDREASDSEAYLLHEIEDDILERIV